jgi:hypothetical protein
MKIKTQKTIKAWAIMPSFPDSKELEGFPFLTEDKQFMVYITKRAAKKDNQNMDETILPCKIVFDSSY